MGDLSETAEIFMVLGVSNQQIVGGTHVEQLRLAARSFNL
jgi:hypothetical protein